MAISVAQTSQIINARRVGLQGRVPGDTLQFRLEEGVSHRRTRQVTQTFTYLLTQSCTAATPTSVCLYFCVMTQ